MFAGTTYSAPPPLCSEVIHLCEQAATERDSQKLVKLVQEINDLMEEEQSRLRNQHEDKRRGDELIAQPGKA